jgi:hypothetical protein
MLTPAVAKPECKTPTSIKPALDQTKQWNIDRAAPDPDRHSIRKYKLSVRLGQR